MTPGNADLDRLRAAWQDTPSGESGAGACPDAAVIWAVVRGETTRSVARTVILHAVDCTNCADALRLAREIVREIDPAAAQATSAGAPARPRVMSWGFAAAAAAAVLILALPLLLLRREEGGAPAPVFREAEESAVRALVPEEVPLERDRFVIRWSGGPPDSRYSARLALADLTVVASVDGLDTNEWEVAPERLAALPAGTVLYWQVVVHPPEGADMTSPLFRARLR